MVSEDPLRRRARWRSANALVTALAAVALAICLSLLVSRPAAAQSSSQRAGQSRATTTSSSSTTTSSTSTTTTDPDLGRRLDVKPGQPLGQVWTSGPVWIGVTFAGAALVGILYALLPGFPSAAWRRRHSWPRRR